jgi:hypothetical protein
MSIDAGARPTAQTRLYRRGIGLLIWLAFAAVAVAALYGASVLMGD